MAAHPSSNTTRRNVLRLIGGGVVIAAGAGAGLHVLGRPSEAAREPWRTAGTETEFRRRALSWALLAPNPHNRQPWLVRLDGENALTLYVDLERRLPVTDPYDRQITIGCGAFLELLSIAAAEDGYATQITPFPDGEDATTLDRRPIAQVRFTPGAGVRDPLFAQIRARRSNKEVYEPRDVPQADLEQLAAAASIHGVSASTVGNTPLAATLRDLTWRGHLLESTTPDAMQESVDLMRVGSAAVTANPDGIELEGTIMEVGRVLGLMTPEALGDPQSTAFQQGLAMYRAMAESGRAFGWLSNANANRTDQLNVGRAYVRMNLVATELGLGVHPWSQSLQEYPAVSALYREVHELLPNEGRIQMLFRIGYGPEVMPTPRRGLAAHLV
ncbi:MAG: Acg family FMN-binding oxidoreductase [Gammaproteobacteria bacterium]